MAKSKRTARAVESDSEPKTENVKAKDLFGDPPGLLPEVTAFTEPQLTTPSADWDYYFPEEVSALVFGIQNKMSVALSGPAGCGKTTLVEQVAERLNYGLVVVDGDASITREHLFGGERPVYVKGKLRMRFKPGIIPQAMQGPNILLINELDALEASLGVALNPLFERKPLVILERNERIEWHPLARIVVTMNTWMRGDRSGLYTSRSVMDHSVLNRFPVKIELDYLSEKFEALLIRDRIGKSFSKETARQIAKVCREIRTGHESGLYSMPVTHRDSVTWAKLSVPFGMQQGARLAFLSAFPSEEQSAIHEVIQRVSGEEQKQKDPEVPDTNQPAG